MLLTKLKNEVEKRAAKDSQFTGTSIRKNIYKPLMKRPAMAPIFSHFFATVLNVSMKVTLFGEKFPPWIEGEYMMILYLVVKVYQWI